MPDKLKRFEKLKNYHQKIADQLFSDFEKAKREYEDQLNKLNHIISELSELYTNKQARTNLNELVNYSNYVEFLENNKKKQAQVVERYDKIMNIARDKYVKQRIEVRKFETLIEKRKLQINRILQINEQKALDEFSQLI